MALVLTRNEGQEIVIDNRITVRIHHINGNRVKVAVKAPRDVHIVRGELEKREAN